MTKRNRDLHAKVKNLRELEASADPPLSYQRPASKTAIRYEPHTADRGETVFEDSRGIVYGVEDSGALRALTKPRSRVKRIRQERAAAALRAKQRKDSNGPETPDGRGEEEKRSSADAHARRESAN